MNHAENCQNADSTAPLFFVKLYLAQRKPPGRLHFHSPEGILTMNRQRFSLVSNFEKLLNYSRAPVDDEWIFTQ